jgi:CheY-like chemotaxis protein
MPVEPPRSNILLAEDDDAVRGLVSRVLLDSGYRVLTAPDGHWALRLSDEYRGPLHLLLTDVQMPGLDGLQLWHRVKGSRPETKVLFMSACVLPALEPEVPFLPKPFRVKDLLRTVGEVLDGASCQRGA